MRVKFNIISRIDTDKYYSKAGTLMRVWASIIQLSTQRGETNSWHNVHHCQFATATRMNSRCITYSFYCTICTYLVKSLKITISKPFSKSTTDTPVFRILTTNTTSIDEICIGKARP